MDYEFAWIASSRSDACRYQQLDCGRRCELVCLKDIAFAVIVVVHLRLESPYLRDFRIRKVELGMCGLEFGESLIKELVFTLARE